MAEREGCHHLTLHTNSPTSQLKPSIILPAFLTAGLARVATNYYKKAVSSPPPFPAPYRLFPFLTFPLQPSHSLLSRPPACIISIYACSAPNSAPSLDSFRLPLHSFIWISSWARIQFAEEHMLFWYIYSLFTKLLFDFQNVSEEQESATSKIEAQWTRKETGRSGSLAFIMFLDLLNLKKKLTKIFNFHLFSNYLVVFF